MKRVFLLLLAAVVLAAGGAGFWAWSRATSPYKGFEAAEVFVEIPPGTGPASMGRRLAEAGVVRDATAFRLAVWRKGAGRRLQAGEYRFDRALSPEAVVERLVRGDVYLRSITFREGLTIREMAGVYEERGFGEAASFIEAAGNAALVRDLDAAATDLEGYLFPDTYALPRSATAATLVQRMVTRFEQALSPDLRARAAARGLDVRELVTLASIVEKETGQADERRIVAAVYSNRLTIGMGLQCDPTVIYALVRAGRYDGNLRRDDLRFDSPYNTYRYAGLPPGPIAAPGQASLEAAADPADVPYLYFVSRNDGSHAFATTLEEHNRNVHQYQVQYFRDRRNQGRQD
jgi:peptidoglycan lytic transglycosylase G